MITYIEQGESWNNYDSLGELVTPLILYGRVIFHIVVKPYSDQSCLSSLQSQYQVLWSLGVYQHQMNVFPPIMSRYSWYMVYFDPLPSS